MSAVFIYFPFKKNVIFYSSAKYKEDTLSALCGDFRLYLEAFSQAWLKRYSQGIFLYIELTKTNKKNMQKSEDISP